MDSSTTLRERVRALPWFHQIDLGGGIITPGVASIEVLRAQTDIYFRGDLAGKSVLDVGCWDGFNSFAAERHGAARVLATDHFAWTPPCWGSRQSIELAREALNSSIEIRDIDLPEVTPDSVGMFDVVLFLGVFYHLRHPFLALENLVRVCKETLIVETHIDALNVPRPAMIFYPAAELGGDASNWWGPNPACVLHMMSDLGFHTEHVPHPLNPTRAIFIGRRR